MSEVLSTLDFAGQGRIVGLPDGVDPGDAVNMKQLGEKSGANLTEYADADPASPVLGSAWLRKVMIPIPTIPIGAIMGGFTMGQPRITAVALPLSDAPTYEFDFSVKTTLGIKRIRLS